MKIDAECLNMTGRLDGFGGLACNVPDPFLPLFIRIDPFLSIFELCHFA